MRGNMIEALLKFQVPSDQKVLLDLYCCGGGAAMGYHYSGFDRIIGVDIVRKNAYPFEFFKADIMELIRRAPREWWLQFELVHASPPCQTYSITRNLCKAQGKTVSVIDHVPDIQELFHGLERNRHFHYVIENVVGAPLRNPVMLCGSSFGLKVRRHRLFEASFPIPILPCRHKEQGRPVGVYGSLNDNIPSGGKTAETIQEAQEAMGIDWLGWSNLKEAIPPAYSQHIGEAYFRWRYGKNPIEKSKGDEKCN